MKGRPGRSLGEGPDVAQRGARGRVAAPTTGAEAPRSGALVLDSQRSVTPEAEGGAARVRRTRPTRRCPEPRKVWIGASHDVNGDAAGFQFVTVPCKTWTCPVCGPRKSRELARVLLIDGLQDAPGFAITLTTHDPDQDAATYRKASAAVWKRLRRHYGRVDYFGFIEFTTGRAKRSGGHRRMHGHYLVKFRDQAPDVIEAESLVRSTWEAVTGAYIVEVAQLVSPGAAIGYLSLHHQKPQQAPPKGWRGMRSRPSKGYFAHPVWKLRAQAREELTIEAIAHRYGLSTAEAAVAYHFAGHDLVLDDDVGRAHHGSPPFGKGRVMP